MDPRQAARPRFAGQSRLYTTALEFHRGEDERFVAVFQIPLNIAIRVGRADGQIPAEARAERVAEGEEMIAGGGDIGVAVGLP